MMEIDPGPRTPLMRCRAAEVGTPQVLGTSTMVVVPTSALKALKLGSPPPPSDPSPASPQVRARRG